MDQAHQLADLEQKYQEAQGTIARLQQRLESQAYELQEQSHKIQLLEDAVAQFKTQSARAPQLDEKEHLKAELLQIFEQRYGRRPASIPEGSALLSQQLDSHTQALHELRREVEKTQRYNEQIELARTEATRLNKEVRQFQADLEGLRKHVDERVKLLTFIEEQNRTNARNLAQLQAELPDLHRRLEANLAKIQLIEQQTPQFTKYEASLDSIREEIRRHREHMDFQAAERERQLKNWNELASTSEQRLKQNERLMEKYAEHYQLNKRALETLQDFQERLQRDQHHFGELQRLAEERQRAELEKIRADYEQRWKKQNMELEPQFGDVQKSIQTIQERLAELTKLHQTLENQMSMVLQILEEDALARASAINAWQERLEAIANGQA
jgi:chromosome segregation ATPase